MNLQWMYAYFNPFVTFQMRADSDASFDQNIKDEEEHLTLFTEARGTLPVFPPNDRLHLLANIPPPPEIWEPVSATLNNVCHLFTSINLDAN